VTIASPDIVAGLPKKKLSHSHVLKMMAGETYHDLKVLVKLTIGQCPL
jgi:hypothetical protein